MKVITLLIAAGLVFSATGQSTSQDNKSSVAGKSAARKVTITPGSPTIPKDATPLPDGSFRYIDKDGKKWIYRNTPFGVSKSPEHPPVPVIQQAVDDPVRTEDLGDSVRFTRPTPFGPKVWTTRKSELSTYEKSLFDRDHQKTGNATEPEASKPDGTASSRGDNKSRDSAKQD